MVIQRSKPDLSQEEKKREEKRERERTGKERQRHTDTHSEATLTLGDILQGNLYTKDSKVQESQETSHEVTGLIR